MVYGAPELELTVQDDLKCDGAPNLTVTEGAGAPWLPANAIEQDDPSVRFPPSFYRKSDRSS